MMYDKINKGDMNIVCNILYRALQRQTISELETGMTEQTWSETNAMEFVHEPIDFNEYVKEELTKLHCYYIDFGTRKFGVMYNSRRDAIQIYDPSFNGSFDNDNKDIIIEIGSETLHYIKDMIKKEDHIYNQVDS